MNIIINIQTNVSQSNYLFSFNRILLDIRVCKLADFRKNAVPQFCEAFRKSAKVPQNACGNAFFLTGYFFQNPQILKWKHLI